MNLEDRVDRAVNKLLFVTRKEELGLRDNDEKKALSKLYEEERHAFKQTVRLRLTEDSEDLTASVLKAAEDIKSLVQTHFEELESNGTNIILEANKKHKGFDVSKFKLEDVKKKGLRIVFSLDGPYLEDPNDKRNKGKQIPFSTLEIQDSNTMEIDDIQNTKHDSESQDRVAMDI